MRASLNAAMKKKLVVQCKQEVGVGWMGSVLANLELE